MNNEVFLGLTLVAVGAYLSFYMWRSKARAHYLQQVLEVHRYSLMMVAKELDELADTLRMPVQTNPAMHTKYTEGYNCGCSNAAAAIPKAVRRATEKVTAQLKGGGDA